MNNTYFYKDKPLFGLDIGYSSIKVMQIDWHGKQQHVAGYGVGSFPSEAIKDGVIVDHEKIAHAAVELFEKNVVGSISTRRVALSVPASRVYTRTINLPPLKDDELPEAVRLETEQYTPMPLDELYIDYSIINRSKDGIELLSVATPKKIVDSHIELARMLGLEVAAFDTSIIAAGRLFYKQGESEDVPTVLIDFGSESADVTVFDQTVIVTGTIPCGGDLFTELIAKKLKVSNEEAHIIKSKYGIGKSKKQTEISEVIMPAVEQLAKEIRRMIRYHEERSGSEKKIGQIITMGGGANMPGLSEFLINTIRLPVRMCDPWQNLHVGKLQPPSRHEKSLYVTVAGLALIEPKELFI